MPDVICPNCNTTYDYANPRNKGKCPACGTDAGAAIAAAAVAANAKAKLMTGHPFVGPMVSPPKKWYSNFGWKNLQTARGNKLWKGIKDKFLPFTFFELVGLAATVGLLRPLAALGLPAYNLAYLGGALVLYGFFYILPNSSKIMDDARQSGSTVGMWQCPGDMNNKPHPVDPSVVGSDIQSKPTCPNGHMTPADPFHAAAPVMLSVKTTKIEFKRGHLGLTVMRSMLKLIIFILLIIQLSPWGGINYLLVTVVAMFIMYFQLPMTYKTNRPDKILESWFRMFLGLVMAITLTWFLTPNPDAIWQVAGIVGGLVLFGLILAWVSSFFSPTGEEGGGSMMAIGVSVIGVIILGVVAGAILAPLNAVPSTVFFFLTFAYFGSMPVREKVEDEEIGYEAGGLGSFATKLSGMAGKSADSEWDAFGTGLFISFSVIAAIPIIGSWMGGMPAQVGIVFSIIFIFSMLTGAMSRESRPYVGSVVLMIAIFAFSFAYTSTIGTAVFGSYWGNVESTGNMFFGPISEQMNKANCQAFATWLCVTEGPVKCAEERLKCDRNVAEAEGSDRAIEFQNYKTDPPAYEIGGKNTIYLELANNGDYDAKDVEFTSPEKNGFLRNAGEKETEGTTRLIPDRATGLVTLDKDSCIGGEFIEETKACVWPGTMPKGGKGAVILTVEWKTGSLTGKDKGSFPWIEFRVSYNYSVRSSYTVDVRSKEEIRRLLLAGESLSGTVAQFSGGPITASIWTPKYIESGKYTLVTASLTNMKSGTAQGAVYCIYVPEEAAITEPSSAAYPLEAGCPEKPNTKWVKCNWSEDIPSVSSVDEKARPLNSKTCNFRLSVDIGPAAQKQLPIVGEASYTYVVKDYKKDVMFAFVSENK